MAQYEMNLHDYWRIIRRRKFVIILTFFFVVLSTGIYTGLQAPIYETSATLRVEASSSIGRELGFGYMNYDVWSEVATYIRIINSHSVYKIIAENLGLVDASADEESASSIISRIGAKIDARRVKEANLIQIFGISQDPREAAMLANAAVDAFQQYTLDSRARQSGNVKQFIKEQLEQAEKKLKISEEARRKFVEKTEATGLQNQLTSKLLLLEEQKELLLKKYTTAHPELKKLARQIEIVESQLKKLPASDTELSRLTREVKVNEEAYLLLERKYKDAQISEADKTQQVILLAEAVVPSSPARPNKPLNMLIGVMMGLMLGLIFALVMENLDTSIGTIEDVEAFLKVPVLGVIPHIDTEKDIIYPKEKNNLHKIEKLYHSLILFHNIRSPFVEAYHTLRTNIKFQNISGKGASVLFTSAGMGEGKSVTSVNYAISASIVGIKTVLVELDLRRPTINKIFGLPREFGLSNVLQGNVGWEQALKGTADFILGRMGIDNVLKTPGLENLKILTCGTILPNPVDVLNSSDFPKLIANLKNEFELVVIDSPPVLLFADAMIAAGKVDGVILVYQVGKMARGALNRAKIQLENVKANIKGVVLNDIRASELESKYGYYYSTYKYYTKPNR